MRPLLLAPLIIYGCVGDDIPKSDDVIFFYSR